MALKVISTMEGAIRCIGFSREAYKAVSAQYNLGQLPFIYSNKYLSNSTTWNVVSHPTILCYV